MFLQVTKNDNTIVLSGNCAVNGKPHSVSVPAEEYAKYIAGHHIQNAMPSVSAEDREFIISGISPEGWKQVMYEEDEPDHDTMFSEY